MSRLPGISDREAGPLIRTAYRVAKRITRAKAGRAEVPEPTRLMAHNFKVLQGFGGLEFMLGRSRTLPDRLRDLARQAASPMIGCHW